MGKNDQQAQPYDLLVAQQIDYYRARAREYDDWFLRRGRYDHGPELNQLWFDEVEQIRATLRAFKPAGRVLELASGTGLWTEQLLSGAEHITAVDAAAETLAINRARLCACAGMERVVYEQADIFTWHPEEQYDVVFFGFWLSHVPPERFASFWSLVRAAMKPGGRFFFVDSAFDQTSSARDHRYEGPQETTATRRLNDGRVFQIVKVFYDPPELKARLGSLGWRARVAQTAHYFIYGQGELLAP